MKTMREGIDDDLLNPVGLKMIAVYFRFKKTNWYGIAVAPTIVDLFWTIDRHGDPYETEIAHVRHDSICVRLENPPDEDEDTIIEYEAPFWSAVKWESGLDFFKLMENGGLYFVPSGIAVNWSKMSPLSPKREAK